ncbi:MAG: glutaredoxin domain-containing protein [Candidatus Parcubacteria bacterium]|nr:glutaredoxin domain-containing protein [Candidatus Parcubacteria bacterium]
MPKLRVFSTESCHYCHALKEFLKENNIDFEDIDVSIDKNALSEMVEKSGQMGVPVVEINGNFIVGFDREKIKNLLNIK